MATHREGDDSGNRELCRRLPRCGFVRVYTAQLPRMAEVLTRRYCKGDWENCARHRVAESVGSGFVPDDLFPNAHERAERIIRGLEKPQ